MTDSESDSSANPSPGPQEIPSEDSEGEQLKFGCAHYRRKCQLLSPCCQVIYTCRFCHDEKEDHELNRVAVSKIRCLNCELVQEVGEFCQSCGIKFGNYFCPKCKLFDDIDKKQFHCDGCGICRVGGRENFFHCRICDMCMPTKMKTSHKCIEKASRTNCPICLQDLHTSRDPSHIPDCGHLIHRNCFEAMLVAGNYTCPLCAVSMINMKDCWARVDEEVASTPMPPEYSSWRVGILCRDCHKENEVLYHVVGLKCPGCGSYNTCRTKNSAFRDPDADERIGGSGSQLRSVLASLLEALQVQQRQRQSDRNLRHF